MLENNPQTYQLARFALSHRLEDLSPETTDQLKKHLLDAFGSLIHCLNRPTIQKLGRQLAFLSEGGACPVPVLHTLPYDRAAQWYTALIRYPDFMDNFLGKEATCHPSDNIGALLSAAYLENASGEDFLLAMATAYEIECRLIEELPVMMKGFDHTLLLAYSLTASLSRLMHLSVEQTAHALSMAGCSFNPLVTCRASYTREWKGLMSSFVAQGCIGIVLMAREGLTGPVELFESAKGLKEVTGMELTYDWNQDHFELIRKCVLKSYNAEVHTQSLVEAALELKAAHRIEPEQIDRVDVTTFLTAYHIVGGGEYGDRKTVLSKEQADHSIPYVIAAALLDGRLYPEQYLEKRILQADVQALLRKVEVDTKFPMHEPKKMVGLLDAYTKAYPGQLKAKVTITLKDGTVYVREKEDYYGFHTRPMSWEHTEEKFEKLAQKNADEWQRKQVVTVTRELERHNIRELVKLLGKLKTGVPVND